MRTIAELQKAAYEWARSKGFHDCSECGGTGQIDNSSFEPPALCKACWSDVEYRSTGLAPMTPRWIGAKLAAIHAEIGEAYRCVAPGRMPLMTLYWTVSGNIAHPHKHPEYAVKQHPESHGFKPEGFGIELADVFLRLCDLAESLHIALEAPRARALADWDKLTEPNEIADELRQIHKRLSMCEPPIDYRRALPHSFVGDLNVTLELLMRLAVRTGVDLRAMAELKHRYNLTRPRLIDTWEDLP